MIHAHWTIPSGLIALLLRKKFICSANGSDIRLTYQVPVLRNIIKFILNRARLITTIGPEIRERIIGLDIEPEKVFILAQVIDTDMFNTTVDGSEIREKYHFCNSPTVLFVGNLEPLKAPDNVLRATALVKRYLHDIRLLVIGRGSMRAALERLARELDLKENAIFVGWVQPTEIAKFLKAGDVLAPTMKDIGIAGVQLEAIAVGTPVISAVPDNYQNFKKAVIEVDVSDYRDIADKILYFFNHQEQIRDRVNKYRQPILDDFSPQRRVEQLEKVYQMATSS